MQALLRNVSLAFPPTEAAPRPRSAAQWVHQRAIAVLTARTRLSRRRREALILGMVAVIGAIDYFTGFWVSLQLFYLIPILLGVLWIGGYTLWVVPCLCVLTRLAGDLAAGVLDHTYLSSFLWNRFVELGVYCLLAWAVNELVALQVELEERVQQRTAALQQAVAAREEMQKQLFEISQRERGAIGHDLHDGLGQHLTATSMAATLLASRLGAGGHATAEDARRVVQLLQDAIAKTRQLARGLLLSAVEPGDLAPELEELASSIRRQHGVACDFALHGTLRCPGVTTASHIFYIAQEAARNAARHAHASSIAIRLTGDEHALVLSVADDGGGLGEDAGRKGMGLRVMQHRSELIGAQFSVGPALPRGTIVVCRVPLAATGDLCP